jgi:hypothetical protein
MMISMKSKNRDIKSRLTEKKIMGYFIVLQIYFKTFFSSFYISIDSFNTILELSHIEFPFDSVRVALLFNFAK